MNPKEMVDNIAKLNASELMQSIANPNVYRLLSEIEDIIRPHMAGDVVTAFAIHLGIIWSVLNEMPTLHEGQFVTAEDRVEVFLATVRQVELWSKHGRQEGMKTQ